MDDSSIRIEGIIKVIQQDGTLSDIKGLVKTTRNFMDALSKDQGGIKGQDLHELSTSLKEMLQSLRLLIDELTLAAAESNHSGALRDLKEAAKDTLGTYSTIKRGEQRGG
jgi:hypothetical protein